MSRYDLSFEEAQEYCSKRRIDIPWNDCDVVIDERHLTETVANVLKWADEHPKSIWGVGLTKETAEPNTFYTTVEQSDEILGLGIDPSTADMKYCYHECEVDVPKTPTIGFEVAAMNLDGKSKYIPCWSYIALRDVCENLLKEMGLSPIVFEEEHSNGYSVRCKASYRKSVDFYHQDSAGEFVFESWFDISLIHSIKNVLRDIIFTKEGFKQALDFIKEDNERAHPSDKRDIVNITQFLANIYCASYDVYDNEDVFEMTPVTVVQYRKDDSDYNYDIWFGCEFQYRIKNPDIETLNDLQNKFIKECKRL